MIFILKINLVRSLVNLNIEDEDLLVHSFLVLALTFSNMCFVILVVASLINYRNRQLEIVYRLFNLHSNCIAFLFCH